MKAQVVFKEQDSSNNCFTIYRVYVVVRGTNNEKLKKELLLPSYGEDLIPEQNDRDDSCGMENTPNIEQTSV